MLVTLVMWVSPPSGPFLLPHLYSECAVLVFPLCLPFIGTLEPPSMAIAQLWLTDSLDSPGCPSLHLWLSTALFSCFVPHPFYAWSHIGLPALPALSSWQCGPYLFRMPWRGQSLEPLGTLYPGLAFSATNSTIRRSKSSKCSAVTLAWPTARAPQVCLRARPRGSNSAPRPLPTCSGGTGVSQTCSAVLSDLPRGSRCLPRCQHVPHGSPSSLSVVVFHAAGSSPPLSKGIDGRLTTTPRSSPLCGPSAPTFTVYSVRSYGLPDTGALQGTGQAEQALVGFSCTCALVRLPRALALPLPPFLSSPPFPPSFLFPSSCLSSGTRSTACC